MNTTAEPGSKPQQIDTNLWLMRYPLKVLGNEHGRNVTIMRLNSGKLVIHSGAPFSPADVDAIRTLGEPGWLVECNLFHDTFVEEAHAAFPDIPYLAPPGLGRKDSSNPIKFEAIIPAPAEWTGEVKPTLVEGMPLLNEYVFLHVPSRTLIVGDLVANFDDKESTYEWVIRHLALGVHGHPSVTRIGAAAVADKTLFAHCIGVVMTWDFDRLIVGHKEMVPTNARELLGQAVHRAFPDMKF